MSDVTDNMTSIGSLRQIGADEKFSPEWSLREDGETVDCAFAIRADEHGPRYVKRCVISFAGLTREQLIDLSRYDVVVGLQRRLRDMKAGMLNPANYATVSVLDDLINGQSKRGPVDPKERAKRDLARLGMSEARIAEVLAELEGGQS